jgi:hypothetical protein
MRIVMCVGMAVWLVACSDDTKAPTDLMVPKPEAKAGDGPAGNKEASAATDTGGPSADGAATGTQIGPAGGQAKSSDGKFVLDVPAGALKTSITFFFNNPTATPSAAVVGTWSELAGAVTDTAKGTVSAKVDHLTCYCGFCDGKVVACMTIKTMDPQPVAFIPPATLTAPIPPPQGPTDCKIVWKYGDCPDPCSDGTKNGNESDVDCGGGVCKPCLHGKGCVADSDCAGGKCSAATKKCDDCANTKKDGVETDVDCGGGVCAKCAAGKACVGASDCTSNLCNATTKKCDSAACVASDGSQNGDETDVDCGGSSCQRCTSGKKCKVTNVPSDCASGLACQSAIPGGPTTCMTIAP